MKFIRRNELRSLLMAQTTSAIISMVCITEPDMRAKNENGELNPFRIGKGKTAEIIIGKVNKVNGNIAGRYERIVENRLQREIIAERIEANQPPLSAEELEKEIQARFRKGESWHQPIMADDGPTCLSINKKYAEDAANAPAYLRFIFKAAGTPEYLRYQNGETVGNDEVSPFLSERSDYSNQGLSDENKVRFVVYAIENIVEIAINGERYRILDNFADRPQEMRNRIWEIAEEYLSGERSMTSV